MYEYNVDSRILHDAQACGNQYVIARHDVRDVPCEVSLYVVLKPRDVHRQAHTVLGSAGLLSENNFILL